MNAQLNEFLEIVGYLVLFVFGGIGILFLIGIIVRIFLEDEWE